MSSTFGLIRGRRRQTTRQSTLPTDVTRSTNEPENQPNVLVPIISEPPDQDTSDSQVVTPAPPIANDNPKDSPPPPQLNNPPAEPTINAQSGTAAEPEIKGDKGLDAGNNTKIQGNVADIIQAKFTPAKRSRVWDTYVKKTDEEDKDLVEDWDRIIDVTLGRPLLCHFHWAGTHITCSKNLKVDHSEATVSAIRDLASIIQAGFNGSADASTSGSLVPSGDAFKPTLATVWVNCLWLLSLGLSISVSLFAMLAKRWCYTFRSKRVGTTYERAMKRQKSWDAIEQWKIELVVEQLPTLMHVALMLFFFGLVVYLSEIHQTAMILTAVLVGFTLAVYFILTILPLWYKSCPMVTPFTRIVLAAQYYFIALNKSIGPKVWSLHEINMPSLDTIKLLVRPSCWQTLFRFLGSQFRWMLNWSISSLSSSRWLTIPSIKANQPSIHELEESACHPDWVMECCPDPTAGKTIPYPTSIENSKYEFKALAWILSNSKDRDSVKEVLDHVAGFPEVILNSLAKGKHLYGMASMAAEHLNRFQHETKDRDSAGTLHFNALCARLMYLTVRPWLHQSTTDGSTYSKIEELYDKYDQSLDPDMTPDELKKQLSTIKKEKINALSDPIPWMEVLARKIVIGCSPEPGLKMCNTLGSTLLYLEDKTQEVDLNDKTYSTLWWIFLNNVMDCTENRWPYDFDKNEPGNTTTHRMAVNSDSLLTLSHFSELQKRQENNLWLAVVAISGMLYAFTHYPYHEVGPQNGQNDNYFATLIGVLRSALRTPLYYQRPDPFIGELPVHSGPEIRLYRFDSLDYAYDALRFALSSHAYQGVTFLHELSSLLADVNQLKILKRVFNLVSDRNLNHALVTEALKTQRLINHAPDIWICAGLEQHTRILDIIFGSRRGASSLSDDSSSNDSSSDSSSSDSSSQGDPSSTSSAAYTYFMSDTFIAAADKVARMAWMPFVYDSRMFQASLKANNPGYMRAQGIWQALYNAGLLSMPFNDLSRFSLGDYSLIPVELERCLLIKASLLERLYSFPLTDSHSPGILAWSVALSKHIAPLLKYWNEAESDMNEQAHTITTFMQLIETLFDAPIRCSSPGPEPLSSNQPPPASYEVLDDTSASREQLKALVDSGILPILSRPFSTRAGCRVTQVSERIPDLVAWHDHLASIINRLAQEFPSPDSSVHQGDLYSDQGRSLPTLTCVKSLRDDTAVRPPATASALPTVTSSPRPFVSSLPDSPAHVRIDVGVDEEVV